MKKHFSTAADVLTFLRLLLGVWLCSGSLLGWAPGLRRLVMVHLAGLTTDILDGNLARRSPEGHGRLASWELPVDVIMYIGMASMLCALGYCERNYLIAYLVLVAVVIALRPSVVTVMLLMVPLAFLPAVVTWLYDRWLFFVYSGWALVAVVLDWNRFCEQVRMVVDVLPEPLEQLTRSVLRL